MKRTGLLFAALAGLTLMGCAGRYYDADSDYRVGGYHGHAPGYSYYGDRERWAREHGDGYRDYDHDRYDRDRY